MIQICKLDIFHRSIIVHNSRLHTVIDFVEVALTLEFRSKSQDGSKDGFEGVEVIFGD
jgi:hypothetical protein